MHSIGETVSKFIEDSKGILKLRPAWVAHDFLEAGRRLGLTDEEYDAGERGTIMERWFCSITHAVNRIDVADEGMSYLEIPGENILVADAIEACRAQILGEEYARTHDSLNRLVKIYDFGTRLFMHIHQRAKNLEKLGRNPKDEAYYFLDAPLGKHPESFFGVHRYIVDQGLQYDIFLPLMRRWDCDESEILKHSKAYLNVPGEGFLLDSGLLHAPGSALTMEIQESSDVGAIFQPNVEGHAISKHMLTKDVPPDEREEYGDEYAALRQVDWKGSADPDFYEKRHLFPKKCPETRQGALYEEWIYYGTTKFSGKRLILKPGERFFSRERGVHNLFVWKGRALVGEVPVEAGRFTLKSCEDELLVTHARAIEGCWIENTGEAELVLFKFFGPDINNEVAPPIGPMV